MGRGEFNAISKTLFEDNILHLPKWTKKMLKTLSLDLRSSGTCRIRMGIFTTQVVNLVS